MLRRRREWGWGFPTWKHQARRRRGWVSNQSHPNVLLKWNWLYPRRVPSSILWLLLLFFFYELINTSKNFTATGLKCLFFFFKVYHWPAVHITAADLGLFLPWKQRLAATTRRVNAGRLAVFCCHLVVCPDNNPGFFSPSVSLFTIRDRSWWGHHMYRCGIIFLPVVESN